MTRDQLLIGFIALQMIVWFYNIAVDGSWFAPLFVSWVRRTIGVFIFCFVVTGIIEIIRYFNGAFDFWWQH